MAKTIKFNLVLDGYPVRDLDGLREHFSLEDMLNYYKNGLLSRWLKVRGYQKESEEVAQIRKDQDDTYIIGKLAYIFQVGIAEDDVRQATGILTYLNDMKRLNEEHRRNGFKKKKVIEDYHTGYEKLIEKIITEKNNLPVLKASVIELEREYYGLFKLDYQRLSSVLLEKAPKAVFAVLAREELRGHWLEESAINSSIQKNLLSTASRIKDILGNDVKSLKKNTRAMWDQIERQEAKIMILWLENGAFVKNAGAYGEKIGSVDARGKFLLLKGLEYQCNSNSLEMLYMEV